MKYKKRSDFKDYRKYEKYVLSQCKSHIEWAFFFTANGKHLPLEWQKKFSYYRSDDVIEDIHCDFYYEDPTKDIKIVIECNDISHKNRTIEDDIRKRMLIEQKGINKVFRFTSKEIIWNCESCISAVKYFINKEKEQLIKKYSDRKHKLENIKLSVRLHQKEDIRNFQVVR